MTPVSVPLRSMHLVPSNSTLKPWCADAVPANPRRQPAATTAPASLIFIALFLPLSFEADLVRSAALIGLRPVYATASHAVNITAPRLSPSAERVSRIVPPRLARLAAPQPVRLSIGRRSR